MGKDVLSSFYRWDGAEDDVYVFQIRSDGGSDVSMNKERILSLFALFWDRSYGITMSSLFCQVGTCIRTYRTEMTDCFEASGSQYELWIY